MDRKKKIVHSLIAEMQRKRNIFLYVDADIKLIVKTYFNLSWFAVLTDGTEELE